MKCDVCKAKEAVCHDHFMDPDHPMVHYCVGCAPPQMARDYRDSNSFDHWYEEKVGPLPWNTEYDARLSALLDAIEKSPTKEVYCLLLHAYFAGVERGRSA